MREQGRAEYFLVRLEGLKKRVSKNQVYRICPFAAHMLILPIVQRESEVIQCYALECLKSDMQMEQT